MQGVECRGSMLLLQFAPSLRAGWTWTKTLNLFVPPSPHLTRLRSCHEASVKVPGDHTQRTQHGARYVLRSGQKYDYLSMVSIILMLWLRATSHSERLSFWTTLGSGTNVGWKQTTSPLRWSVSRWGREALAGGRMAGLMGSDRPLVSARRKCWEELLLAHLPTPILKRHPRPVSLEGPGLCENNIGIWT